MRDRILKYLAVAEKIRTTSAPLHIIEKEVFRNVHILRGEIVVWRTNILWSGHNATY